MPIEALCHWIEATPSSTFLRESIWGFTILASLHVLGIAWFGGAVVFQVLRPWRRIGAVWMLATGALLFWLEPLKCYSSVSFRVKMLLLLAIGCTSIAHSKIARAVLLLLWAAVIFASQGIAFY
jgi:hypothetical protein